PLGRAGRGHRRQPGRCSRAHAHGRAGGMIKSIDHIVILVHDLEATVRDYGALGFTVVPGGEHADGRSRNALVAFSDGSYLELIAFKDNVVPESHNFYRPHNPEGLVTFALLPTDIEGDV